MHVYDGIHPAIQIGAKKNVIVGNMTCASELVTDGQPCLW